MTPDPHPHAPAIRLDGVGKAFGLRRVLDHVDLEVSGRTVAIVGANGAGKSTLLRVAAGLSRPTSGRAALFGHDTRAGDAELGRRHVSVLVQDAPVYAELTPAEHLRWWARVHRAAVSPDALERAAAEASLAPVAHAPAGSLSRGQRQRLALALAFLPAPRALILDEPFSALDADGRAWARARLEGFRGAGATVLLAVHEAAPVAGLADRTLTLSGGHLA
jgi:Cu-processing system ATP-binding protein